MILRGDRCREGGQASVELVGAAALLALAGLAAFQVLATGHAVAVADGAAEAAALALANGRDPGRAARAAAPGWPRRAMRVERDGGTVRVTLAPRTPLGILRGRLRVGAEAWIRRPGHPEAGAVR
jgi:hypothetical protein